MEKVKENVAVYNNEFYSIQQTVEIPENHRLTIEVPCEIPTGPVILTFTPPLNKAENKRSNKTSLPGGNAFTVEEAFQMAKEKANNPNRKPISRHFGTLSKHTFGNPVAYQRAIRDEWD